MSSEPRQFHALTPELVYAALETGPDGLSDAAALERLAAAGITTREACGNSVRNVTACAHAGVCAREVFDVTGAGDTVIATLALALAARKAGHATDHGVVRAEIPGKFCTCPRTSHLG